jgi:hypothetical protein
MKRNVVDLPTKLRTDMKIMINFKMHVVSMVARFAPWFTNNLEVDIE